MNKKSPLKIPSLINYHNKKEKFSVVLKEENTYNDNQNEDQLLRIERYPSIEIEVNESSQISLRDVVEALKHVGYSFENRTISYYDSKQKIFVFCRKDENLIEYRINVEEIQNKEVFLFAYFSYP